MDMSGLLEDEKTMYVGVICIKGGMEIAGFIA